MELNGWKRASERKWKSVCDEWKLPALGQPSAYRFGAEFEPPPLSRRRRRLADSKLAGQRQMCVCVCVCDIDS